MNPKSMTNEELAVILRAMAATGMGTSDEREYLREAADRLEGDGDEEMLLL